MSLNDDWCTPQPLFDELNREFNFTVDLAATAENKKCIAYMEDFLIDHPMSGLGSDDRCFLNPPYSRPKPFIERAWECSEYCLVVCLVKVDTSTKWWSTFWNYEKHQPKPGCQVRFLPKRVKFVPPPQIEEEAKRKGKKLSGPTFPSAVIIMDRRGVLL